MDHREHRNLALAAFRDLSQQDDRAERAELLALAQFHALMANYELSLENLSLHGSLAADDVTPEAGAGMQAGDPRVRLEEKPPTGDMSGPGVDTRRMNSRMAEGL